MVPFCTCILLLSFMIGILQATSLPPLIFSIETMDHFQDKAFILHSSYGEHDSVNYHYCLKNHHATRAKNGLSLKISSYNKIWNYYRQISTKQ